LLLLPLKSPSYVYCMFRLLGHILQTLFETAFLSYLLFKPVKTGCVHTIILAYRKLVLIIYSLLAKYNWCVTISYWQCGYLPEWLAYKPEC